MSHENNHEKASYWQQLRFQHDNDHKHAANVLKSYPDRKHTGEHYQCQWSSVSFPTSRCEVMTGGVNTAWTEGRNVAFQIAVSPVSDPNIRSVYPYQKFDLISYLYFPFKVCLSWYFSSFFAPFLWTDIELCFDSYDACSPDWQFIC